MKRLAILFLILIFGGCAGLQPKNIDQVDWPPVTPVERPEIEPQGEAKVGEVFRIEDITSQSAANKIRAFTEIEGGGAGALDAIDCQVLAENDLALAFDVNSTAVLFYWFDDGATDAEASPGVIRPDNYATCGDGVWKQLGLRGIATINMSSIDNYQVDGTSLNDMDLGFTVEQTFSAGLNTNKVEFDCEDLADDTYQGEVVILDCGDTDNCAVGDIVFIDPSDADPIKEADATAASGEYPAFGIVVVAGNDGSPTVVMTKGCYRDDDGYNWTATGPEDWIYLGESDGTSTQTKPSTSNDCIQIIGRPISADVAYYDFSRPYLLVE